MSAETDAVWRIFPMIYIISGVIFNIYKFVTFVMNKVRRENIFTYFIVLTVSDSVVLVTSLLSSWFRFSGNIDVRSLTKDGCHFHMWLSGIAMDIPPWILVVMSYEKRAFLWYPVPADSQFSKTVAKLVIIGLIVLCAIRRMHVLWGSLYLDTFITFGNDSDAGLNLSPNLNRAVGRVVRVVVCGLSNDKYGVFMALYGPWIDLVLRVFGPFVCLAAYNTLVLRKLYREKYCATRLMQKVGIVPPSWFYVGVMEVEYTVKRAAVLTFLMLVNNLPYSFYFILQPAYFETYTHYKPAYWLVSNMMYYLNYCCLYPIFAVYDHHLLVTMRDTWRSPLARKRGSNVTSLPPRIMPVGATRSFPDEPGSTQVAKMNIYRRRNTPVNW